MQHEILTGIRTTLLTTRLNLPRLIPPTVRLSPLAARRRSQRQTSRTHHSSRSRPPGSTTRSTQSGTRHREPARHHILRFLQIPQLRLRPIPAQMPIPSHTLRSSQPQTANSSPHWNRSQRLLVTLPTLQIAIPFQRPRRHMGTPIISLPHLLLLLGQHPIHIRLRLHLAAHLRTLHLRPDPGRPHRIRQRPHTGAKPGTTNSTNQRTTANPTRLTTNRTASSRPQPPIEHRVALHTAAMTLPIQRHRRIRNLVVLVISEHTDRPLRRTPANIPLTLRHIHQTHRLRQILGTQLSLIPLNLTTQRSTPRQRRTSPQQPGRSSSTTHHPAKPRTAHRTRNPAQHRGRHPATTTQHPTSILSTPPGSTHPRSSQPGRTSRIHQMLLRLLPLHLIKPLPAGQRTDVSHQTTSQPKQPYATATPSTRRSSQPEAPVPT